MIEDEKGLKEFYQRNKEYLPILLILPTLFGALIQLVQLTMISPTFYKFFSITQSIIDGSFILFQILLIIIIANVFDNFANSDEFHFFKTKIFMQGNTKQKSKRLFWRFLIINTAFIFGIIQYQYLIINFRFPSLKPLIFNLIFALFGGIIISRRRTKLYLKNLLQLHKKRKEPRKNNWKYNVNLNYIIPISILLLISIVFTKKIPNTQFNNDYIVNKMILDYGLEDAKILFYSDTYLIMNLQNKDSLWQKGVFKTDNYFKPSRVFKHDDD